MWKRKTSSMKQCIEFFNGEPSVIDNYPIIESKDLKLNWVKGVREDFQNHAKKKDNTIQQPGFRHLSLCPGIFDLFKYGYIIPLPKDIIIKPKGKDFSFAQPTPLHKDSTFGVNWQSTELIARPPWTADFIVKIDTGWHVIAPRGVKFLMLPIAYPDTFDFTATTGILDPAVETKVNFQMFWNTTEPETLIRAGTPLGHLIPLTEKRYEWTQRTMNQKDRDWTEKLTSAYSSSFWHTSLRGKVVDMYNKYWKR
jgi:hypothetical protein